MEYVLTTCFCLKGFFVSKLFIAHKQGLSILLPVIRVIIKVELWSFSYRSVSTFLILYHIEFISNTFVFYLTGHDIDKNYTKKMAAEFPSKVTFFSLPCEIICHIFKFYLSFNRGAKLGGQQGHLPHQ